MQERLVIAGLEHIRNDQEAIRVFLECLGDCSIRETIHTRRRQDRAIFLQGTVKSYAQIQQRHL